MKKKSGMFKLEPDKFSIHTFEISKKLTNQDYKRMRDRLYCQRPKGEIYRDRAWQGEGERHRCRWFQRSGLRISLEKDVHGHISTCYLWVAVNPRKLINPNSSYLGILPPTEESVQDVSKMLFVVLKGSGLPCVLDAYQLSRVDLCVNIRCDSTALFKELLRVARKLPTPPKYERAIFKSADRKTASKYNRHHITLKHKSRELVIYDKTYQIIENGLLLDEEKLPKGVLRFEVHELRERISKVEKKLGTGSVTSLLCHYIGQSERIITRCFGRAYPDKKFMQPDRLRSLIHAEANTAVGDGMARLAEVMVRVKTLKKGVKKIGKEGYDAEAVLAQFARLSISPFRCGKSSVPGPCRVFSFCWRESLTGTYRFGTSKDIFGEL